MKRAIITGITGQDGAYLAKLLLEKGQEVIGVVRNRTSPNIKNLSFLGIREKVQLVEGDLTQKRFVDDLLINYLPDEVYNLAAQSSVGESFRRPIETVQFNTISVLNFLECIREINRSNGKNIRFYQASSSEMYGVANTQPITLASTIHPLSPYAISKAAAHWSTINYREAYEIFAVCGILFNHESFLRRENFFIKKLLRESLQILKGQRGELRVGNIDIKRDFGYGPKYVEAMWLMLQQKEPKDYLVCSGTSVSLRSVVEHVFERLKIPLTALVVDPNLYRPTEIEDIFGDNSATKKELGWSYEMSFFDALDLLIEEERRNS